MATLSMVAQGLHHKIDDNADPLFLDDAIKGNDEYT